MFRYKAFKLLSHRFANLLFTVSHKASNFYDFFVENSQLHDFVFVSCRDPQLFEFPSEFKNVGTTLQDFTGSPCSIARSAFACRD